MTGLTVTQELTLYATLTGLGMLVAAILCVLGLMGILHGVFWLVERRERRTFTSAYGAGRYGKH